MNSKTDIKKLTLQIKRSIEEVMSGNTAEEFWVAHYGANDIHPRYLVYWICVQSDEEKKRLQKNEQLMVELRSILDEHNYPIEGRKEVSIGFESQETVDRISDGNWFYHWK